MLADGARLAVQRQRRGVDIIHRLHHVIKRHTSRIQHNRQLLVDNLGLVQQVALADHPARRWVVLAGGLAGQVQDAGVFGAHTKGVPVQVQPGEFSRVNFNDVLAHVLSGWLQLIHAWKLTDYPVRQQTLKFVVGHL